MNNTNSFYSGQRYEIERGEGTSDIHLMRKKKTSVSFNENASPRSRRLLPESHLDRRPLPNFFTNGVQSYKVKKASISKEIAEGKI